MHSDNSGLIAKTVLVSSLLTILVLVGVLYVFRGYISDFIVYESTRVSTARIADEVTSTSSTIEDAVALANDAVVSVIVTKDVPIYEQYYETVNPWGIAGGFRVPRLRESGTEEQEVGGGSGFIVSNAGHIVTNRHVVEDTEAKYSVLLNNGRIYAVTVLALDEELDIAILQIDEQIDTSLPYLTFGNSDDLRLGQTVIAIGNALAEFQNSVSVGVVSGLGRSIVASDAYGRSEQLNQVIQTDAAINPGNSGGPLLNAAGEVIGVNVAISRGADNIGFALPGNVVAQVVRSVREYGTIVKPFLGVRYTMLTEAVAERNNLDVTYGALITQGLSPEETAILEDSPADRAGLRSGDVIVSIDDYELVNQDLSTVLRSKSAGDIVRLGVYRDGRVDSVEVQLEEAL